MAMSKLTVYKSKYPRRYRKKQNRKLATVSSVKRIVNANSDIRHYFISERLDTPLGGVMSVDLTSLPVGDNFGERSGDDIKIKNIRVRGTVLGADSYNRLRIIMFQWRPDNSSAPIPSDVIDGTTIGSGTYCDQAPYNVENDPRYKVLYDRRFVTGSDTRHMPFVINFDYLLIEKKFNRVKYNNSGSTNGSNHIYMLAVSDSGVATHPQVFFTCDITYVA